MSTGKSFAIALVALVVLTAGVQFSYDLFAKSAFQRLCERNGHFWIQSVPMYDGQALSSDTVTGCFLDAGLYHFADAREYAFFLLPQEITAELRTIPETPIAHELIDLVVSLKEVREGRVVGSARDVGVYHDRILHAIIVGEDLQTFAHIHPEDLGPITPEMKERGEFPLRFAFPKAGRYAINIDYVASGRERSGVFFVDISPGIEEAEKMEPLRGITHVKKGQRTQMATFGDYDVRFTAPKSVRAGERVILRYDISKNGIPVRNLEPYLAAAMHVGMVKSDLSRFTHTHGEALEPGSVWFQQLLGKYFKYHTHFAPDAFGPTVITQPWTTVFPTSGTYQVFGEFKHEGKIVITRFVVEVE